MGGAKVISLDAFRPCTCCGAPKGAHSQHCPKRMTPEESWEAWGCKNGIPPCRTLEDHIEHVNHLTRSYEKARKERERTRPALQALVDKLAEAGKKDPTP